MLPMQFGLNQGVYISMQLDNFFRRFSVDFFNEFQIFFASFQLYLSNL